MLLQPAPASSTRVRVAQQAEQVRKASSQRPPRSTERSRLSRRLLSFLPCIFSKLRFDVLMPIYMCNHLLACALILRF